MHYTSPRFAGHQFDFARVTVILGANGAGKSKLLAEIRDAVPQSSPNAKAVFIEGGRTITIADVLQLDAKNFNQFDRLESAVAQYEKKRSRSLASRVFDALVVLEKREQQIKSAHSDEVERWAASDRQGEYPKRKLAPLARLFELFSEIFPQIALTFNHQERRLIAQKNEQLYGPSNLSDGEKQVFSILADLIDLDTAHQVIIADEPELNLHPELAERLWTLIESEFYDKTFIYATHSINFALRANVQKVYVLSSTAENIAEFHGLDSLPRQEVTAFLGGLPGILSANRVVVTEGHEKSFDAIFYRWLLNDPRLEIYPAGGCSEVSLVVTKTGLWDKISSRISICGVVDADFRDDEYLANHSHPKMTVLALHEAESYLCLPSVAVAVADRIGSQEPPLSEFEVQELILESLRDQRLSVAARRVIARSRIHLGVSVEKRVISASNSRDELVLRLRAAAEAELDKATATVGPDQVEAEVDRELALLDAALAGRDIVQALRLLPAKEVLGKIAPRVGCKSGTDYMRALKRNFEPSAFAKLDELRVALQSHGGVA